MSLQEQGVDLFTAAPPSLEARRFALLAGHLGLTSKFSPIAHDQGCSTIVSPPDASGSGCAAVHWQDLLNSRLSPVEWLSLISTYGNFLIYGIWPDPAAARFLGALTQGQVCGVGPLPDQGTGFAVSSVRRDIVCEYAGLAFGRPDPAREFVLQSHAPLPESSVLVSIGGAPHFVTLPCRRGNLFLLAGEGARDIHESVDRHSADEIFAGLIPASMYLRYANPSGCWHPCCRTACVTIDDPLLVPKYGCLNYARLEAATRDLPFSLSLAFIPYNCRRTNRSVAQLFRQNPTRFSISVHGNDHTRGELGKRDAGTLQGTVQCALRRMAEHGATTGLGFDRVMVPPQEIWSPELMPVLKANGFLALASCKAAPAGSEEKVRLDALLSPAVMSYSSFPLLLRKYARCIKPEIAAFWFFWGKPMIICEHHTLFRHGEGELVEIVKTVNAVGGNVAWMPLGDLACNAYLLRRGQGDAMQVRLFSGEALVRNMGATLLRVEAEKIEDPGSAPSKVQVDGCDVATQIDSSNYLRCEFILQPMGVNRIRLQYSNTLSCRAYAPSFTEQVKLTLRRRVSEVRAHWVS